MNAAVPTPVQNRRHSGLHVDREREHGEQDQGEADWSCGKHLEPVRAEHQEERADAPGDAHPGDEELEHEEHEADRQQEVRDRRARDGVQEAGEQVELEEANLHDRLGARPA